jgi:hypothetical protein
LSASSRVGQIFILIHWIKIDSASVVVSLAAKARSPKKEKSCLDKGEGTPMGAKPRVLGTLENYLNFGNHQENPPWAS